MRARLEAIAAGKGEASSSVALISEAVAEKHQGDFAAWARFSDMRRPGEPLSAPAELLTPLP